MAQTKDTVLMEELSWVEIADHLDDGYENVILACGAIEQHGPHLPTGVDTYLGYALAEAAARKLGDTLVAPTLRPGVSPHHTDFRGTISVSLETFVNLLWDYCESLARTGFENVVIVPSHGGNYNVLRTYIPDFARKLDEDTDLYFIEADYSATYDYWEEHGIERGEYGGHAGIGETARMLAKHPDLVDMDLAEPGMTLPEFFEDDWVTPRRQELFKHGMKERAINGILGDPRRATAEHGERINEIMAKKLAERIRERIETEYMSIKLPDSIANEYK